MDDADFLTPKEDNAIVGQFVAKSNYVDKAMGLSNWRNALPQ